MSRYTYAGGAADFVFDVAPNGYLRLRPATLLVFASEFGGARVTDLQLDGGAVATIPVADSGQVPSFEGPDAFDDDLWVATGADKPRIRLAANAEVDRVEEAAVAAEAAAAAAAASVVVELAGYAAAAAASAATAEEVVGLATVEQAITAVDANPASPVRVAQDARHSATYAGRGGKTKTDGQNIKNHRRPTLAVDKWWPNAVADHQVVYVDETAKVAYSVGQDNRFRKSTWIAAGDEAILWGFTRSQAAAGTLWCAYGVFLKIPTTHELLMDARAAGVTTLVRSIDDGVTWTPVWTSPGVGKMFLGPQSVVRDENTGYLFLVEYTTGVAATTVDIWRSTNKGATWEVWKSYPRSEATAAGALRHWHSARYDAVSQRVYFLAGDQQSDGGIYRVNAGGTDIELVVKNSALTAFAPAAARAVDVMFFPDYIAWACDGSGSGQNHVYRMHRNQIGLAAPMVEQVAAIDNTGWWTVPVRSDKSMWLFSTSTETPTPATSDAGMVHLYAVSDDGGTVDEVSAITMDGNNLGFASLSALGGNSGTGDAFWLRAHTYQQYPNVTQSAFQLRARIGFGVVPLVRPGVSPVMYQRQGRNVSLLSVVAGATKTWGSSRAPKRTTKMSVVDMGAMALNPKTYNSCKVEIWNATTSTKLTEWGGMSLVHDGNNDTADRINWYVCAAGDEIEFRLTNTHATVTLECSAFVAFGWSLT